MNSAFMKLEAEKRGRIIDAAMAEFGRKGYKDASTNEIVKSAGISKGLLFHYFENKKGLFFFLLDYAQTFLVNEFYKRLDSERTDIIARWRQIMLLKIDLIRAHPDLYDFLLAAGTDDAPEIKREMDTVYQETLVREMGRMLANVDTSCFREGLDVKRVSDIIIWVVCSFGQAELEKMKKIPGYRSSYDIDAISAEFDRYLELLKGAFYK